MLQYFLILLVLLGLAGTIQLIDDDWLFIEASIDNVLQGTNGGSVGLDRTVYPVPWEDRPPLKQLKDGIDPRVIHCNDKLVLIQKYDGSPACVKPSSVEKLIERGWANLENLTVYIFPGNFEWDEERLRNPNFLSPAEELEDLIGQPIFDSTPFGASMKGQYNLEGSIVGGLETIRIVLHPDLKWPNGTQITVEEIEANMQFGNGMTSGSLILKDQNIGASWIVINQKYDPFVEPRLGDVYSFLFGNK